MTHRGNFIDKPYDLVLTQETDDIGYYTRVPGCTPYRYLFDSWTSQWTSRYLTELLCRLSTFPVVPQKGLAEP